MTIKHENSVPVPKKVKSVAVIGGGPSGAITLDSLIKENAFDRIVVYERKDSLGGVWNYDESFTEQIQVRPGSKIDELDPPLKDIPELTIGKFIKKPRSKQFRFSESAGYKDLRTNVPQQLMCFTDERSWGIPDERKIEEDYCLGTDVKDYIIRYFGRHDKSHVVYRTSLENVYKDYSSAQAKFELTLRHETDEIDENGQFVDIWFKEEFDAIIIATGHYHIPYIPEVAGLEEIYKQTPDRIVHSKYFKPKIHTYKDEVVVVIGGRISGLDIVISLSKTSRWVYHSTKDIPDVKQKNDGFENIVSKPLITKYEIDNDKITVFFSDGTKVENVDRVLYATGFHMSFPFMERNYPSFTDGTILPDFYEHTFYTKDPLISIVGIPVQAITFKAFEYQAIWISRFLSGKSPLPPLEEQQKWIAERKKKYGSARLYHALGDDKYDWTIRTIEAAGGVRPPKGTGKEFYTYTEEDKILQASVLKRYAEEVYFFLDPTKQYF